MSSMGLIVEMLIWLAVVCAVVAILQLVPMG